MNSNKWSIITCLEKMNMMLITMLFCFTLLLSCAILGNTAEQPSVSVKVMPGGESITKPDYCRGTIVGPGINQPDPFPGYTGFVGWESPILLKNGDMLVGFSAGYWHFSPPTAGLDRSKPNEYTGSGMPNIDAPRGGRAMITRSSDGGKTWSKSVTLVDTDWDDRHPSFLELPSGVILCTFFKGCLGSYKTDKNVGFHTMITRSTDGGRTWEEPRQVASPFVADETDGPMVLAKDGSVYMAIDGDANDGTPWHIGILRSTDEGKSWKLLSKVKKDYDMYEPSIAELPDGSMILITRPEADLYWSYDKGKTWTKPVSIGMRLFAPSLIVLKDGTLLCLHGSYGAGGLRAIFSTDGGHTWVSLNEKYGFLVDNTYGYGKGIQLDDGSVFMCYLSSGGHTAEAAANNAVYSMRLRIRSDHSGIDLLPAPNKVVGK
jgi:photosystem II stability/assembly factor-like uncharacterized protein